MGWLTMTRGHMGSHTTPKAYLDAQFTYERKDESAATKGLRVLRSAYVDRIYYAACEPYSRQDGTETAEPVFAVVCLTRWTPNARDGHVFGYKNMTEHSGPNEARCPEAILTLLGSTSHEYALDWRRRCLITLERRRRTIAHGDRIRLASKLRFSDGFEGDEFMIEKRARRIVLVAPHGGRYQISRLSERDWTVIPATKIHAPVFAPSE